MGSYSEATRTSNYPSVKQPNLVSLREYASLLPPIERMSFDRAYGKIIMLLQLEIQTDAIAVLSHFYDSPSRCFMFKNFQMSPTLEEYVQIFGFPQPDIGPYQYQGRYYTDDKMASLLQTGKDNLKLQKKNRNQVVGFPQEYLESRMKYFADAKNWGPFKQVLALTIFGVVLFPRIESYVDTTAIGAFLSFKDEKNPTSPIPAILADTYCAFTHYSELKGRKISCCLHALYVWLLTHAFVNKVKAESPIEDAKGCDVKTMNTHEWLQVLRDLHEYKVRWYPSWWKNRPEVILQCGSFQNVPLMGTRGCINYNPSLTLRQLGYPMRSPPTEDMLIPFYLHEGSPKEADMLRRISQAWNKIDRRGQELTKKSGNKEPTFRQWLQKKIQNTRLPYQSALWVEEKVPEPTIPTIEELDELKLALSKAEEEKKSLRAELEQVHLKNQKLKEENTLKSVTIKDSNKRFEIEEKGKQRVQKYLDGAKEELRRCNLKLNMAIDDACKWKELWEESMIAEKTTQSLLVKSKRESRISIVELKDQLRSIRRDKETIEEILREYQQALRGEQERSDELKNHIRYQEEVYHQLKAESIWWESRFMGLVGRLESHEVFIELKNEGLYWKDKFSKLAWLANQAVTSIPERLKKADAAMHPLNTPVQVFEFVEFCKVLITDLKKESGYTSSRKRERSGKMKAICN